MMKKFKIILIIAGLFAPSCYMAAAPLQCSTVFALVIGNSEYLHVSDASNALHDADIAAGIFRDSGAAVELITNCSVSEMRQALDRLYARLASADNPVAILYYSGQAFQTAGKNYLLPSDCDISLPLQTIIQNAVPVHMILRQLAAIDNVINLIIIDAGWVKTLADAFSAIPPGLAADRSLPAETLLLYASLNSANPSEDGDEYSSFAQAFQAYFGTVKKDIRSLAADVTKEVMLRTDQEQQPWFHSTLSQPFCLHTAGDVTVTWHTQGGKAAGGIDAAAIIRTRSEIDSIGAHPVLEREGYFFSGWWTEPEGKGVSVTEAILIQLLKEMESRTAEMRRLSLYANWTELKVGKPGPGGGIICYDKGDRSGGWRYLEAGPVIGKYIEWSPQVLTTPLATSTGIGSGKSNTRKIIGRVGYGSYAALLCEELMHAGFTDWFLPSLDELLLVENTVFSKGIGSYPPGRYWSSSVARDDYTKTYLVKFSEAEAGMYTLAMRRF